MSTSDVTTYAVKLPDVGEGVAEDAVVTLADRGEREGIGGSAIENEEDVARGFEDVGEKFFRAGGVGVVTIARDAVGVGGGEGGEGLGADAGGVVAREGEIGARAGHGNFGVWQGGGRRVWW